MLVKFSIYSNLNVSEDSPVIAFILSKLKEIASAAKTQGVDIDGFEFNLGVQKMTPETALVAFSLEEI
jgi:hypothetical protein